MGIKGDDTCLGMEVVHSKHSINVIYVTNTITIQTIQVPVLWGVSLSLASFLCLWTLSSFSCTPSIDPKACPNRCTEASFSRYMSLCPFLGDPASDLTTLLFARRQRGAFCSQGRVHPGRGSRPNPANYGWSAGRLGALAHRFPTAAKKAPQCSARTEPQFSPWPFCVPSRGPNATPLCVVFCSLVLCLSACQFPGLSPDCLFLILFLCLLCMTLCIFSLPLIPAHPPPPLPSACPF